VHHATVVMMWVLAVLGAGLMLYGLAELLTRRSVPATPAVLGRFWYGMFLLVETGPRLAGWPAEVVLALSVLAVAPVLLALKSLRRA
jgi:hypothetical protein